MLDNNIIQSLGAGSGIDTNNLVRQLTAIERAAPQERIDNRRDLTETQISDFGLVSSALATLRDAARVLTDPEGLFSKTASFTESDALVPTELDTDVQAGTYAFTVSQVAQAQSIAFAGFADPTDAVGEGTLTFSFGSWTRDGAGEISGAFNQDTDRDSATITIDSNNNSLQGLRDAINDADIGVTASIVFDGSDYHLTLLASSGEDNQLQIDVAEAGASPSNTDDSDLSRFAFNSGIADIATRESQRGQDAVLTINGLEVRRANNTVDDVVEGLSLDILKATEANETVSITVSDDLTFAEQNIRAFVDAYNLFLETLDPVFGVNEVENEDGETETIVGSLANDALAKSVLTQIRGLIAQAVPGLTDSNLTSLTNIGIRTELDGTLSIDENDFSAAFEDNFADVQKLFSAYTASTSDEITINTFNDRTAAGSYDVIITQAPARGFYDGDALAAGFPLDTSSGDYSFVVELDGISSNAITLPAGSYAGEVEIAAAIQSAINADSNFDASGASVTVSYNTVSGGFDIVSAKYGVDSNVAITSAGAEASAILGLAVRSGTAGTTVAGTVNGVAAFGSANVLLPALGEPGEGLTMIVGENAANATLNVSRGFAGELEALIDSLLSADGPIALRETNLENTLEDLDDDQESLDRRISAYEERLIQQYIAMERILASLDTSSSFLDNLLDTLPFTARDE